MLQAKIKAISYYLPNNILTNENLNEMFPEWSADKISNKTGIYERRISDDDEFSSDMAVKVGLKLFEEHNIKPSEIDFLLLCTQSPDYFLPTTACIVQDRLNIPKTSGALDFNLGCSGYIYGLSLAKGLIYGGIARNILLITSETYSKFINKEDKSNLSLFGDGASATLISTDGFGEILDFELGTDGSGYENLIVRNGAMKNPCLSGSDFLDEFENVRNDNNLFMNGSEIFNFTSNYIPDHVQKILNKSQTKIEEIDLFIFHQANKFMLNHLRKKIIIPEEKFYLYLRNCGNTVSSTIPIAMKEAMNENRLRGKVLLTGFGVGYSWGSCIIKIDKNSELINL